MERRLELFLFEKNDVLSQKLDLDTDAALS